MKTVNNKLSMDKTSVVQRMRQLIFFQPPPSPKLANADLLVMVRKIPIIQARVVYAPLTELLKPPDTYDPLRLFFHSQSQNRALALAMETHAACGLIML